MDRLSVGVTGDSERTTGDIVVTLGGTPVLYIYEYGEAFMSSTCKLHRQPLHLLVLSASRWP